MPHVHVHLANYQVRHPKKRGKGGEARHQRVFERRQRRSGECRPASPVRSAEIRDAAIEVKDGITITQLLIEGEEVKEKRTAPEAMQGTQNICHRMHALLMQAKIR